MQNSDYYNNDKLNKTTKLSLTSPIYNLDFGQPNNNHQNVKKNTRYDSSGNCSQYAYNGMQFQMNYMPSYNNYYHQMPTQNYINSHDDHKQNNERNLSNKTSYEKLHTAKNDPLKPKDKIKPNGKEGLEAQNKQPTIKKEQGQVQVQEGEPSKKKKKNKKKKEKKDKDEHEFSDNPWMKPLKKALKKSDTVAVVTANGITVKANKAKQDKIEPRVVEIKEENKNDEQEKKKFKFLRVRDIRKRYYANRANKPVDRVSQLRAKEVIEMKKKKKLSKVKKAKLRYLELQLLNAKRAQQQENLRNKEKESEDGYETVDEKAEEEYEESVRTKGKIQQESKNQRERFPEEGSVEKKEGKEKPEDKKFDIEIYFEAVPELEIPEENRPQVVYKDLKVRRWVDHILCEEIDRLAFDLLNDLLRMQTIKKLIKPTKSKKRILCGMREVMRSINTPLADQAAKCVVIAINIQENPLQQGGDEKMLEIIVRARNKKIPIIHACSRKQLGQACTGNDYARISVVSVTNYFGADDMYKDLLQLTDEKRKEFQDQIAKLN